MKLEEKYLNENTNNNDMKKILKAADKLVIENMNLVMKHTDKIMKEVEKKYIKDPNSVSTAVARDIFLSSYISSFENYLSGMKRSLRKI